MNARQLDQNRRTCPTIKTRFVFGNNLPSLVWALVIVSAGFCFSLFGDAYLTHLTGAASLLTAMFQVALGAMSGCNYLVIDRGGVLRYAPFGRRQIHWRNIHFLHVTHGPSGLFFALEDDRGRVIHFEVEADEQDQLEHFIRSYANLRVDTYPNRLHSIWQPYMYTATIWAISTILTLLVVGPNIVAWVGLVHVLYYLGRSLVDAYTLELTPETLTVRCALPFRRKRRISRAQLSITTTELQQALTTGETEIPILANDPNSQKKHRLKLNDYQGGPYRALQILAAWYEADPAGTRRTTAPQAATTPVTRDPNCNRSLPAL